MSVRIGVNPIGWSNDDLPELGGDTPLETCLAEAREAGFAGVELGNKFPRDPAALAEVLRRFGLSLASGWYSARLLERSSEEELAAMTAHADLLAQCGARVVVFAETTGCVHGDRRAPLSRRPRLSEADWPSFAASLTRVAEGLASRGLELVYHHHMGTVVETEAEIDRLMSSTGSAVKLLLDTGHLAYAGGDPMRVLARWGRRVAHVHLKDVRAKVLGRVRAEDTSFLDAVVEGVFTVPGDGSIAYEPILGELARLQYSGWLVVEAEQDPAVAHPLTYARMGYQNVASLAVGAGLMVPELVC